MDCRRVRPGNNRPIRRRSGFILCASYQAPARETKIYRYDEMHCRPGHEKRLLQAILEEMGQYDLWIGHNAEKV